MTDPGDLARQESANTLRQFEQVRSMVESFLERPGPFHLRPSHILHLHRAALRDISSYAGNWRPAGIEIGQSKHKPPPAFAIPEQVEFMCDYVNDHWQTSSALHLSAYVMWRLNWIHPFTDGNGRTSRAVSYLVLCMKLGHLLPGSRTIPDQISADRTPYYKALECADDAQSSGRVDVGVMEQLLGSMLAEQLAGIHRAASHS